LCLFKRFERENEYPWTMLFEVPLGTVLVSTYDEMREFARQKPSHQIGIRRHFTSD